MQVNSDNNFSRVTLKMILLHVHVSERAKLYCRPDLAIEFCLYSELAHLLSATFNIDLRALRGIRCISCMCSLLR